MYFKRPYSFSVLPLLLITFFAKSQAPGTLDPTFGGTGKVQTSLAASAFHRATGVAVTTDRIYVSGTADESGDLGTGILALNLNGTPDAAFDTDGKKIIQVTSGNDNGRDVIVQTDGKILIGGFTPDDFFIIRLNTNGSLDNSWGGDGIVETDITGTWERINRLVLQSDGKIIAAGYSGTNINDITVARYNTDGNLDNTFGTSGSLNMDLQGRDDRIEDVVIQDDGKIILTGSSARAAGDQDGFVMRLNVDGSLDNTFNTLGYTIIDNGGDEGLTGVTLLSDNTIICAGASTSGTTGTYKFNIDGSLETSYGLNGFALGHNSMWSLNTISTEDRIYVFGYTTGLPSRDFAVLAFDLEGNLVPCFGAEGLFKTDIDDSEDYLYRGAMQPDGKLVITGDDGTDNFTVVRIISSGDLAVTVNGNALTASRAGAEYQWVNCATETEIPGAVNQTYIATAQGSYKVKIIADGCTESTACFDVVNDANYTAVVDNDLSTVKGPSMGSAWVDFNDDDHEDIFVFNYSNTRNFMFENLGDKTFENYGSASIVSDLNNSYGGSWADYNNDGFQDLFVSNNSGANFLYKNDGGTFSRIATGAIATDVTGAWDAGWADYNNDGLLDIYVNTNNKNFLYKGTGNDQFEKITLGNIVNDNEASFASAWGDYNNDGFVDLFVSNYGNQNNSLYKNSGDGTFQKIVTGAIVTDGGQSRSASWGDYDNDGFLDLYVTNSGQQNFLYRNNGNETFTKITGDPIVNDDYWSYSSAWTDYNNDGYIDMAVVNSTSNDSVSLFRNNKDGSFTRIRDASLIATGTSSWSLSPADFNNDGYEDIYVAGRGNNKGYLFENLNKGNRFIGIKLKGVQSNTNAIGARVRIKSDNLWQTRQVASKSGRGGQGSYRMIFGTELASTVDSVVVYWPGNKRQVLLNKATNQNITIEECESYNRTEVRDMCDGDLFSFGGEALSTSGEYTHTFLSQHGCDSTVTLTINVHPGYNISSSLVLCTESIEFGSQTINEQGIFTETFQTIWGCDSVVTVSVISNLYTGAEQVSICEGDSFLFANEQLSEAGVYTETFQSAITSCDSTVTLTLSVSPVFTETIEAEICSGEYYEHGNQHLTATGSYPQIFQSSTGCDSTVVLNLIVHPMHDETINKVICEGETFLFGGEELSETGVYHHAFVNVHGCDSAVHLQLEMTVIDKTITQEGPKLTSNQEGATYQWIMEDGIPVEGETARSFIPSVTGAYAVSIDIGECNSTSDEVEVIVLSTETNKDPINVYPNPIREKVLVRLPQSGIAAKLYLRDQSGKVVREWISSGEDVIDLDLREITAGFYILEIKTGNTTMNARLVKE